MEVVNYFFKRPNLFWSLVAAILFVGVFTFIKMPKLEDPAVAAKQAMVVVPYPGASAHEVELKVAQLMEDELRALPNVKKIKSECQNGSAMFTVEFKMTVLLKDLEQHFDLLRRKVNDIASRLPNGCYTPVVVDDMMDVYGIFYAFKGDGYTYNELYQYAKMIRRELLSVSGVKRINITGNRDDVINIILPKEKISRNGLIPTQIAMALQNSGKTISAGEYESGNDKIQIRVTEAIENEEDVANLLISTLDGKQIRLGDVAKIERTYSSPQRNGVFVDGSPALAMCIAMEDDAIVPDVGAAVDERLSEILHQMPVGMEVEKIFFQPDLVVNAISSFMVNLLESVLIVIVILIFAMGMRSGMIIGFGLILTIAVSFPILLCFGTTLQRISLGAFIVAMGMLVDNAIVIMDGILIDKRRGLPPKTYLLRIGKNMAMPLLGATVIAASTFLCIYLSPDSAGEYAADLFLVLCVSLLASWIFALVQVPMCAKSWMPAREKVGTSTEVMNSPMHQFIRRTIDKLIKHKKMTIASAIIVLALCGFGMTKVKNMFFPDFEYNQFVVECFMPSQTNPDKVRDDLLEMTALLKENGAIKRVTTCMGSAPAHYCLARPMTSGGDCYGELIVDCDDYSQVQEQIPIIRKQLREAYPDAYIRIRKYNFSIATSHTVEVEFSGPDPAVLRELSKQAEAIMRQSKYVDPYSVENNWKTKGKSLVAEYVRQDALRAGVERGDVANALMAATDGMPVGALNDQERTVMVNLMVRNADGSKIQKLDDIPVWSSMNVRFDENDINGVLSGGSSIDEIQDNMFRSIPLSGVTDGVKLDWEEDFVYRVNGQRAIEAQCDPNSEIYEASPAKVVEDIKDEIESIPLPGGYKMRWVGEGELQGDALANLVGYVPLTILIILGVLLMLFNNWKKITLVIFCLPFVLCGIAPLLLIAKQPFTFMAIIGLLGLIGMMVKNTIVLIDEITRLQEEEKLHPYKAIVEATVSRVRPVMMASLTTIVGMIPLVPDPMFGAMAVTIMGGLTMGTIITLILLPVFYTALFKVQKPQTV